MTLDARAKPALELASSLISSILSTGTVGDDEVWESYVSGAGQAEFEERMSTLIGALAMLGASALRQASRGAGKDPRFVLRQIVKMIERG